MALEYIQYNDPSATGRSQETEVVLNFLTRTVVGEPYSEIYGEDKTQPLLYGIVDDGQLVAAGGLSYPSSIHPDTNLACLDWLAVVPEQRGNGLGRKLLELLEQEVRRMGALGMLVDVIRDTGSPRDAYSFYEHLGYTTYEIEDVLAVKYF